MLTLSTFCFFVISIFLWYTNLGMTKYMLQLQHAQIQKYNKIYFLENYVIVVRSVSWFTWDGLHKQILVIPGCSMFVELVSSSSESQRTLSWYLPSCNQCWHFKSKIEHSTQVNVFNAVWQNTLLCDRIHKIKLLYGHSISLPLIVSL
jgi:hypothetical protein